MKETEIKSIIDRETYKKVKQSFNWEKVIEQENHYYTDKDGLLREKRIMVRVRVIDDTAKLQVKLHKNSDSPIQICEENQYDIDGVPDKIDEDTAEKISGFKTELYRMGSAVTVRRTLNKNGSELCLDKTTYFDKTDYEVEVEYEDKMSADLFMKITELGVKFDKSSVGKFTRFLEEYNKHWIAECVK